MNEIHSKNNIPDDLSIFSLVYGLSGTSGSGKSTASEVLASLGATIISADKISREVSQPDGEAYPGIVAEFGDDILDSDKTLDRKKLHKLVFSNPGQLKKLESILHPVIRKKSHLLLQKSVQENKFPLVYETPLLFEKNLDRDIPFKKIIYISSSEDVALQRIMKRDNISKEEALARIRKQLPDELKRKRAQLVIENNGTIDEFRGKIKMLFNEL